jgi:hypothetical protein
MSSCLDDARFNPSPKVDDDALRRIVVQHGCERLPGLQNFNGALWQSRLIDVGGAVFKIIGDQQGVGIACIANGMRRLTLASLDRIKEYGHGK